MAAIKRPSRAMGGEISVGNAKGRSKNGSGTLTEEPVCQLTSVLPKASELLISVNPPTKVSGATMLSALSAPLRTTQRSSITARGPTTAPAPTYTSCPSQQGAMSFAVGCTRVRKLPNTPDWISCKPIRVELQSWADRYCTAANHEP